VIGHDLRFALRSLRKSPGFVATTIVTLGLGLALSTTMFSMLDAVRHPHVPFRDPDRLIAITPYGTRPRQNGPSASMRAEIYQALKTGSTAFSEIAGVVPFVALAQAPGYASNEFGYFVTANYLAMIGVSPELGRTFAPGVSGAGAGVVISYPLWKRAFQGRPLTPTLTLTLGDQKYDVIGVMPYEMGPRLWLRMAGDGLTSPDITPIGRLAPGVTLHGARAEVAIVAERLASAYGTGAQPFSFQLRPCTPISGDYEDYHAALLLGAIVVLVLACGNVANLMMARGLSRHREMALRLVIGASRGGLVRQLLAEAILLALAGAALGGMLGAWGIGTVRRYMPTDGTSLGRMMPALDWRFFLVVTLTSGVSLILFGLIPALRTTGVSLSEPLKDGGTTTVRHRRRYSLVVVSEVALCLAVLMGAVLLDRALDRVERARLGFDIHGLLRASLRLSALETPGDRDVSRAFDDLLARLRHESGVADAATSVSMMPASGALTADLEGAEPLFTNAREVRLVSPNFLRLLGIPIVDGRDFEPGDQTAAAVAIVDEAAMDQLWGGQSPVGHMIKLGGPATPAAWVRVVGVSRTARLNPGFDPFTGRRTAGPTVFVVRPGDANRRREVVIRVSGDEGETMARIESDLRAMYPRSMDLWGGWKFFPYSQTVGDTLETRRFLAGLFTAFALFALVLAAVGLYAVLAYAVSQRVREFGVRVALGADARNLRRLVLHDGAVMVLGGIATGTWIALGQSSLLDFWLYDLHPTDVLSLVIAETILLSAAMAACWLPARRAAQTDPGEILRAT
jgi:predicted permease